MAEVQKCDFDSALEKLIEVTEKSKKLRSDLKQDIMQAVSELRTSFCNLMNEVEEKNKTISVLAEKVKKAEEIHNDVTGNRSLVGAIGHHAPSVCGSSNYSAAVRGNRPQTIYEKNYKLVLKSKQNESTDAMKVLLKRNINPTQLKVGIRSMKALRDGRLIIESGKKEDIDILKKISKIIAANYWTSALLNFATLT
ncbi:hypothetical protein L9F63_013940 [Diploptera punctata]|uniref:Uncharacterized protein n=1 Tax=Diploptera punctata TaxID=6984 RepID=A0AAD8EL68_DIPPU|nr:hypothetical protein L9F63_013940 [Diploptera punctata]